MTSIHPPVWWNGPLGPLTTGRGLYEVSLPGPACRVRPGARHPAGHVEDRRERRTFRDLDDRRVAGHLGGGHRVGARRADGRLASDRLCLSHRKIRAAWQAERD